MRVALLALCCLLAGCSNVAAIGEAAGNINSHAARIEERAQSIINEATKPEPDFELIVFDASQVKSDASSIRSEVNAITANLGGVRDEGSQLLDTLKWVAIAGVLIAVVVIGWRFGLDRLVYGLIAMTGIPTAAKRQAEMDAAVIDEGSNESVRESIAAKRASSPLYDLEFKRARKRLGKAKA